MFALLLFLLLQSLATSSRISSNPTNALNQSHTAQMPRARISFLLSSKDFCCETLENYLLFQHVRYFISDVFTSNQTLAKMYKYQV